MTNSGKSVISAALLLTTTACAIQSSSEPLVDPVVVARARIEREQAAETEAKKVCVEMGLPNDRDCLKRIKDARLGTGSRITLSNPFSR